MRILFCLPGYKPAWRLGGPVASAALLAERLAVRGHHVTVVATNTNFDKDLDVPLGKPLHVDGVEVWYFNHAEPVKRLLPMIPYLSRSLGYLYSRSMAQALCRLAPSADLIHAQMPFVYPTLAAAKAAFSASKPLFYHQRGSLNPSSLKRRSLKKAVYLKLLEIPIMKRATTLIALTEAERESYRRLGVCTACHVVPNAVNVEEYSSSFDSSYVARLGIIQTDIVVLFLGRLSLTKGIGQLVEAFLRVLPHHPRSRLCIAGSDEHRLEAGLRARVEQAGAGERVSFFGMVEGKLKKQLLGRANLFCLPSATEGFSVAALEALASETAVLLSPQCDFAEVEHVDAGRISNSTPEGLEHALRVLLSDPERMRAMGQLGRVLIQKKYSAEVATDRLVEVYEEGLARFGSPRQCVAVAAR